MNGFAMRNIVFETIDSLVKTFTEGIAICRIIQRCGFGFVVLLIIAADWRCFPLVEKVD
jgi:hypothetical protein